MLLMIQLDRPLPWHTEGQQLWAQRSAVVTRSNSLPSGSFNLVP